MLLIGVLFLPIAIYIVGANVFGDYAGAGFGEFFRDLHGRLRNGEPVIVFLLLSPYLIVQTVRLTWFLFVRLSPGHSTRDGNRPVATGDDGNL